MSEHQLKEQSQLEMVQQAAFTQAMASEPAVFVNGFGISSIGRMPRVTFTEGLVANLPPHVRAAVIMHPEDLAQFISGAQQLLTRMEEAGLWKPSSPDKMGA